MNVNLTSVHPMIYADVYEGMVVIVQHYTIKQDPYKLYACNMRQKNYNQLEIVLM